MAKIDKKAYDKLDYPLALVSVAADGKYHGCIVNSLHQATSSFPARFTVTVNKDHETCKAIQKAGSFSATLVGESFPKELMDLFGYKSGRIVDKFAGLDVKTDEAGNPYLTEHMLSRISCRVEDQLAIGNYVLFVGVVTEAETFADGKILTVKSYAERGKAMPTTATVYRTVELNGYRCAVCGYVHEGESLPEDFVCPICRAKAKYFEKIDK